MKLLFVSNLFPDRREIQRGLDNAQLLKHLASACSIRVVAPRPRLPWSRRATPEPRGEDAAFCPVFPPAWYLPKVGSRVNHLLLAGALRGPIADLRRQGLFEMALVSWLYPDGCAVARLAREMGFPFVLVAQGSDVHQYLRNSVRRRLILEAIRRSGAVICRSADLARLLREAGAESGKLEIGYNGVDTKLFHPADKAGVRRRLGLPEEAFIVAQVGNLLPIKNPLLSVEAFGILRRRGLARPARLVFVGDGPLRAAVEESARRLGLSGAVMLTGRLPDYQVAAYLQAADTLCLSSWNEGLPNVILEALAAGLPVVATRVGGISEVVNGPPLGRLVAPGDAAELADALAQTMQNVPPAEALVDFAQRFSWERTAQIYLQILRRAGDGRSQS